MSPDKPERQNQTEQILILIHVQPLILTVILSYLINLNGIFKLLVPGKNQWELALICFRKSPLLILQSTENLYQKKIKPIRKRLRR